MSTVPRYRHVGALPIVVGDHEVQPGEEFSASMPDECRNWLISIGAIVPVPETAPSPRGRRAAASSTEDGE